MHLKKLIIPAIIAFCLFGIWTSYVFSHWDINVDVILFIVKVLTLFSFSLPVWLILYILAPHRDSIFNVVKILIINSLLSLCLIGAFALGVFAGEKILEVNIGYTKEQAEPIIRAIEDYRNDKGTYPAKLVELNIPVLKPKTGGMFAYKTYFSKVSNKQEFSLDTGGRYGWLIWESCSKEWYVCIEHFRK